MPVYSVTVRSNYALGSLQAGQDASLFTWGTAAGPMQVDGAQAALAWTFGDFNGAVESALGEAVLLTYGTAAASTVTGATDAWAYVVGDFQGSVYGGQNATAVTLGDFHGTLDAGTQDGLLFSQGSVDAAATAGQNLLLYTEGDLRGNYLAGLDGSAVTYGDFAADFYASQDLTTLWARGRISGRIEAGRDLGSASTTGDGADGTTGNVLAPIFSHAGIDAELIAGRNIGLVQSSGAIAGLLQAADTIQGVESGAAVSAVLTAPNTPTPLEFSTWLSDLTPPDVPPPLAPEMIAAADAVHSLVLDQRAEMAAEIADLLARFAAEKTAAQDELDAARAAVTDASAAALADESLALSDDIELATAEFQHVRDQVLALFSALGQTADSEVDAIQQQIDAITDQRNAAYQTALAERTGTLQQLSDADAANAFTVPATRAASSTWRALRAATWETSKRRTWRPATNRSARAFRLPKTAWTCSWASPRREWPRTPTARPPATTGCGNARWRPASASGPRAASY